MDRFKKWRLILGKQADPKGDIGLEGTAMGMDGVLEALYDSDRKGGLGASSPNVNRWLGDIRKYFPTSVVQVMQKDALERLNLEKMLTEPELLELVEPDVNLVATLISLNKVLPAKTRASAKAVIKKVVDDLEKRLRSSLIQSVQGALNRSSKNLRPKFNEINWQRTVRANLKHYQSELGTIIPELLIGHGRKSHALRKVILLVDQSGSMANSIVYAGVFGSVLASLRSVKTHFIAFDTEIADLTLEITDPVELLFGVQLGGGTDINAAIGYAQKLIQSPDDTIFVLISDLFEGGNEKRMLKKVASIKAAGVQFISLLALDDNGSPAFDRSVAAKFANLGVPAFACTPDKFPALMEAAINKSGFQSFVSPL